MPSFQHFRDPAPVYEGTRFPYTSYQHYTQPDQTWILTDPALTQFQQDFELQQKHNQNVQREAIAFQHSVANSEYLPGFQHVIDTSGSLIHHTSWDFSHDNYRKVRYNSPSGQYGGTLSESSSDYGFSPENRTSSMVINECSQPFAFLPTPIESCLGGQEMWHNDHDFIGSLPSPPDSTTTNTHAIALRELEFSCGPEYYHEQFIPHEATIGFSTGVHMHVPEELELTDSIATLTTSSRAHTILASNDMEDESDRHEIDNDSDPDFNPRQITAERRSSQSSVRNLARSLSSRRIASTQSHPVQGSKSRVQKSTKRSATHGNKEKRRSRTHTNPAQAKSYSAGTTSKAPKFFPCTFHVFGCQATFGNKNEWKRHVSSQHLQLGFFRCDLGECNPDNVFTCNSSNENRHQRKSAKIEEDLEEEEMEITYNDFNRKDLFTQHCRRMHGPHRYTSDSTSATNQMIHARVQRMADGLTSKQKTAKLVVTKDDEAAFEIELEDIRRRCWQFRRKAPARSCCGFCNKVFQVEHPSSKSRHGTIVEDDGKAEEKAWEERMEHIGKHYERDNVHAHSEPVDEDLEEWGVAVGILTRHVDAHGSETSWLVGCGPPSQGAAIVDESADHSPRRSGLRSRGQPSSNSSIETEDEKHVKNENSDDDSDDDASGEDG